MKAKFSIPPPEEWMQFEIVCKKVWGFVWNIPNEIDFNSTNTQGQQGIDLIGIPRGEKNYFGIQCKNKRLHLKSGEKNKITTSVIDQEIIKASEFVPGIQKLIIATSLYRDKDIEEYVRIKNIEQIRESKFTIQICFWEYISEIIQENQLLYNWYLGQRDYISSHKVEVELENEKNTENFHPIFIREKRIYRHQTKEEYIEEVDRIAKAFKNLDFDIPWHIRIKDFFTGLFRFKKHLYDSDLAKSNILIDGKPLRKYPRQANRFENFDNFPTYEIHQLTYFRLIIRNVGANVIEDYKLSFSVEGDFEDFDIQRPPLAQIINKTYPIHSWKLGERKGYIEPEKNFLIQNDQFESCKFYILPKKNTPTKVIINWTLLSRDYSETGTLNFEINPKYIDEESIWYIHPNSIPYEKYCYRNKREKGVQPLIF